MQQSDEPFKIVLPFAQGGGRNVIPTNSLIGITEAAASLVDGFPPITRTPKNAGGKGPRGLDMNGILFEVSGITRWANAGGGFVFDADFANDDNVNGYPKGARLLRSDGLGYWINTVDNNTTDPDAGGENWIPDSASGVAIVALSAANTTLTPNQYGCETIVLTGALVANISVIFPAIAASWSIVNKCTGNFKVSCRTASGAPVSLNGTANSSIFCDGLDMFFSNAPRLGASRVANYASTGTILSNDIGTLINANGVSGPYTLTLPPANSCQSGSQIRILCTSSSSVSIVAGGSDSTSIGDVALSNTDTIDFQSNGTDTWYASGGSALVNRGRVGEIAFFCLSSAPPGFLKANGAEISRGAYASLFSAIGTTFGAGDGSTTFNLPDLRGVFARGWADDGSIDSGRIFGSSQLDAMQGHYHSPISNNIGGATATNTITAPLTSTGGGVGSPLVGTFAGAPASDGTNGIPRTDIETRPINLALLACIKY